MSYLEEAIRAATEKGGYIHPSYPYQTGDEEISMLLDPAFWRALGVARGNKPEMRCDSVKCDSVRCEYAGYKDPHRMFTSFTEHIWNDGDIESFFRDLSAQSKQP